MGKRTMVILLVCAIAVVLNACAGEPVARHEFMPQTIQSEMFGQKVDNFLVVLDASSSMLEKHNGEKKFSIAKNFISNMNSTLPDLKLNGALRSFGHADSVSKEKTMLAYGWTQYTKQGLSNGLAKLTKAGGISPLDVAESYVSKDLAKVDGKTAVILISDGKDMSMKPVENTKKIVEKFGDRVCIYTILVGDDEKGKILFDTIARTGGCGISLNADNLATGAQMSDFVKRVFIGELLDSDGDGVPDTSDKCPDTPSWVKVDEKGCPLDADNDGVADYIDQCPDTPSGVSVDRLGCPIDADNDGVPDYMDKCPGTPKGEKVDQSGCTVKTAMGLEKVAVATAAGTFIFNEIQFDTNKWDIKDGSKPVLDEVIEILEGNPALKLEVQGHTDNTGSMGYNTKLSEKRAKSVVDYMTDKGISADRLTYKGYGPAYPIRSNDTAAGRASNRRVEFKPLK